MCIRDRANTQRSFEVYDDYLVHGDGNYRISLFAQGEDGSWNDNYYYLPVGSTAYILSLLHIWAEKWQSMRALVPGLTWAAISGM